MTEKQTENSSFSLDIKRSDLHLRESQWVIGAGPATPVHAVSERRVIASQVETVQVGRMTFLVPPGTFERHCTGVCPHVVVLVSSTELVSTMAS